MSERLSGIEPIRREPLANEIARRLVEYLLSGEVSPGERMPSERELAQAFGVGRSAMREAIKSLSLLGLVEVRHGDGTYLRKSDSALLPQVIEWGLLLGEPRTRDLVEARQKLEQVIAGLAARRRTDADIAALRECLATMGGASGADSDPAVFVDADVQFHLRLAEAAGNTALRDVLLGIQALLRAWIRRAISLGDRAGSLEEHVPVLEAVERGDPDAAERAMAAHMMRAGERLERALDAEAAAAVGREPPGHEADAGRGMARVGKEGA